MKHAQHGTQLDSNWESLFDHLFVHIAVRFTRIPYTVPKKNPGGKSVSLMVTFNILKHSSVAFKPGNNAQGLNLLFSELANQ